MPRAPSETGSGTTAETTLNSRVAETLRRFGLDAEAEQSNVFDPSGRKHRVDALVELEGECVAIEAEFAPARSVKQDALSRLPVSHRLTWRGSPITRAFTLVYPSAWQRQASSASEEEVRACKTLKFRQVTRTNGSLQWSGTQTGSVNDLADLLLSFWTRSRNAATIDQIVNLAADAVDAAATVLREDPYIQQPHDDSDPAATSALVWLNALLFQELLAANLPPQNMPAGHQGKSVPVPRANASVQGTLAEWQFILSINWHPIFVLAQDSLSRISTARAGAALSGLRSCAKIIAQNQAIQRHDIAGRIFHRLLNSRKFLATNYTTIPAAVMLSGLAFGSANGPLSGKPLDDEAALANSLRIVDPACGSGTLLMAALQDVLQACRTAKTTPGPPNLKPILEESLWGYDVVPGAEHLTNTTLSMAATSEVLSGIHIYTMSHDMDKTHSSGRARLGSLDFLKHAPNRDSTTQVSLFPHAGAASRRDMSGEEDIEVHLPEAVDLFISNPPFTRAGGPGSDENTSWNPLFGSVLSATDAGDMQKAMRKTLTGTIGSLYAGLGSAFMALIDQEIHEGKMLAVVLPLTAVTGSRWRTVREALLNRYRIEWVIASHDTRNRTKTKNLPGRRMVSFSESTRIAETLIVAIRNDERQSEEERKRMLHEHRVKFVNLRYNPDDPTDAIALTRALLNHTAGNPVTGETDMLCSDIDYQHPNGTWGEIVSVPQSQLPPEAWPQVAFTQCQLTEAAVLLQSQSKIGQLAVPVAQLDDIADLGPYHMQIKGKRGLFNCRDGAPSPAQTPALWHHTSDDLTTLTVEPNAVLTRRRGLKTEQDQMLARVGRLHLASELGHAPQRLAAVVTSREALGVSSWITLLPEQPRPGWEEAMCLWLNSTPGMLLRIMHANRPYLGRSRVPHELARTMPVLDVSKLTAAQLTAARQVFDSLKGSTLQGFAHIDTDPARRVLNSRLITEVLDGGTKDTDHVDGLTAALATEPTMTTRH